MTTFPEYDSYDALGLAELVTKGELSPRELLQEAIGRSERLNPTLNAIVLKHYQEGQKQAEQQENITKAKDKALPPFAGVPFLLKNLNIKMAGTLTNHCSRFFSNNPAAATDSTLTSRYKAAGLVIFGKTNSPELGLSGATEPRIYGPCHNPWDRNLSAGGSSGGAAAAVAAGIVPMAHASDGGGSIRIPASACGLFGLKPSRARTPSGPDRGEGWGGMSISHAITRTVRDSAALLDAVSGPEPGAPYSIFSAPRPFLDEVSRPPGRLKIAFSIPRPDGDMPHKEVVKAMEDAVQLCCELGHEVEEAKLPMSPIDNEVIGNHQITVISANVAWALAAQRRYSGLDPGQDVERVTAAFAELGQKVTARSYIEALQFIHTLGYKMARFHNQWDIYLCPTLSEPPWEPGVMNMMSSDLEDYINSSRKYIPYTTLFNMTGQPSMSLPLYWSPEGLPIGVMFSGRYGEEGLLFRLAAQLERARPWAEKRAASLQIGR